MPDGRLSQRFKHGDEVCLVQFDVILPAVNGLDMVERILQVNPDVKILLMSGYSEGVIEQQGRSRFPFIRKPFIDRVLIEKIQSLAPRMQQLQERNSFTSQPRIPPPPAVNACCDTPNSRQMSPTFFPPSASRSARMICSSVSPFLGLRPPCACVQRTTSVARTQLSPLSRFRVLGQSEVVTRRAVGHQ